ncbi:hypothetical protein ACLOJK_032957 [Asimina triloba]
MCGLSRHSRNIACIVGHTIDLSGTSWTCRTWERGKRGVVKLKSNRYRLPMIEEAVDISLASISYEFYAHTRIIFAHRIWTVDYFPVAVRFRAINHADSFDIDNSKKARPAITVKGQRRHPTSTIL